MTKKTNKQQSELDLSPWLRTASDLDQKKRIVFLAYQDVFNGERANLRRHRSIQKVVSNYYTTRKRRTGKMGLRDVTRNLAHILKEGWMTSNSGARRELLNLFPSQVKLRKLNHNVDFTTSQDEEDKLTDPETVSEEGHSEYIPSELEGEDEQHSELRVPDQNDREENDAAEDSVEQREIISRWQAGLNFDLAGSQDDGIMCRTTQQPPNKEVLAIRSGVGSRTYQKDMATLQQNLPAQTQIDHTSGSIERLDAMQGSKKFTVVQRPSQSTDLPVKDTKRRRNRRYRLKGYPVPPNQTYLPFKLQHAILTSIQKVLEECCFFFTRKWLPSVLEQEDWDSPEAGELHIYCRFLLTNKIPPNAIVSTNLPLSKLLNRIKIIRHAAVHRFSKIPIVTIADMVKDAVTLVSALRDEERTSQVLSWQRKLEGIVVNLKSTERSFEQSLIEFGSSKEHTDAETISSLKETFGLADNDSPAIEITRDAVGDSPRTLRRNIDLSRPSPVDEQSAQVPGRNKALQCTRLEVLSLEDRRVTRSMTREQQRQQI